MEPALAIPLEMSADCAALAHGVTLGVLFSRGRRRLWNESNCCAKESTKKARG